MRYLIMIFLIILSNTINGQLIVLDKKTTIDTLYMNFAYSDHISNEVKQKLDSSFRMAIKDFNQLSASYIVLIDSILPQGNYLYYNVISIKYASIKFSIIMTGVDLALIAGHIIMISNFGWTLPIWPFLFPGPVSRIDYDYQPNVFNVRGKPRFFISANGYFLKKEKQTNNIIKSFYDDTWKLLKKFDKQNIKSKKRQS